MRRWTSGRIQRQRTGSGAPSGGTVAHEHHELEAVLRPRLAFKCLVFYGGDHAGGVKRRGLTGVLHCMREMVQLAPAEGGHWDGGDSHATASMGAIPAATSMPEDAYEALVHFVEEILAATEPLVENLIK